MVFEIIKLVGAGVVGGLIGAYASHRFTLARERAGSREDRRRKFVAFMAHLRAEAADQGQSHPSGYWGFYRVQIPNLKREAAMLDDIFQDDRRSEFERLVSAATGFTWDPMDHQHDEQRRKEFVASIDVIAQFMRAR